MKGVAIVGCGFVANYYMLNLSKSKRLKVTGVLDSIPGRAAAIARFYSVPKVYQSLEELLADDEAEIVLNLTSPRNHYEITLASLNAGKHVYSEKPMAMTVGDAKNLAEVAKSKSLQVSCAPCNVLGEAAQTMWKALRNHEIGKVLVAYAALEEDMMHKYQLEKLRNKLGVLWPAKDKYETGLTLEHAGYYLSWLAAFLVRPGLSPRSPRVWSPTNCQAWFSILPTRRTSALPASNFIRASQPAWFAGA